MGKSTYNKSFRLTVGIFVFLFSAITSRGQTPLLTAIVKNDTASFEKILEEGCNVNKRNLYVKTRYGVSRKKKLRSGKTVIDKRRRKGMPLIFFQKTQLPVVKAALHNNYYFVSRLLDRGAKVNKKDKKSILTTLAWAAHNGNHEMVVLLLKRGADINGSYKTWRSSPLIEAIEWRHWDIASLLIGGGANIHIIDKNGKTALSHAAVQKNYELVKLLIEKGADVNHIDKEGFSVLENACSDGVLLAIGKTNFEIIKLLVEHGARTKNSAVYTVARKGETGIVKYLLARGAPVTNDLILYSANGTNFDLFRFILDSVGLPANGIRQKGLLHRVCSGYWTNGANRTVNIPMLKYVLEKGADINDTNEQGENVFTALVAYGKPDSITYEASKLLLEKNNKKATDRNQMLDYPLKLAAYQGLVETSRLFIENGADVNHFGEDSGTVLHQACWKYDNRALLQLLIKYGADINGVDNLGQTPAMGCITFGRFENVKTLVELGADINKKDRAGKTLLDLTSDPDLLAFLKSRGAKSGDEN